MAGSNPLITKTTTVEKGNVVIKTQEGDRETRHVSGEGYGRGEKSYGDVSKVSSNAGQSVEGQ
jgi:hypothetical protein